MSFVQGKPLTSNRPEVNIAAENDPLGPSEALITSQVVANSQTFALLLTTTSASVSAAVASTLGPSSTPSLLPTTLAPSFQTSTPTPTPTPTDTAEETCTYATPGRHGAVPITACNSNYFAPPATSSSIAFLALFSALTLLHLGLAIKHKKRFAWVLVMGSAWEAASFVFRTLGAFDQQSTTFATLAQLFLLLAPLWINAFAYMAAGRMAHCFLRERKTVLGLRAVDVGRVFVCADVFSFVVQAVGGVMLSPGASGEAKKLGLKVYMAGVGVQQAFVCVFVAGVVRFHWRMRGERTREGWGCVKGEGERDTLGGGSTAWLYRNWRALVWALYAVLVLITIRITFRLVEFARGITPANTILYNENYVLLLDALPMIFALLVLALVHPGAVLQGPDAELPPRLAWWRCCARREARRRRKEEESAQRQWQNVVRGKGGHGVALDDLPTGGRTTGNEEVEWRGERRRSSFWSPLQR